MADPAYNNAAYKRARSLLVGLPCHYCGEPDAGTVDHVVPVAAGGDNSPANLVPACGRCNYSKGAREGHAARRARTGARRKPVRPADKYVNPRWL